MRRERFPFVPCRQQPILPLNSQDCPTRFQRPRQLAILLTLLLLVSSAIAQRTWNVPADRPTIQAGIDAASDGDTVLVAPGTYFENIDFLGKAITVTSSAGTAKTILDGSSLGPAVIFKTFEGSDSILSNFTILHGGTQHGNVPLNMIGSIYVSNSWPTILNNVITQSNCWGIQTLQGAPIIQGNIISATLNPNSICTIKGSAPTDFSPLGGSAIWINGNLPGPYSQSIGTPPVILGNTLEDNVDSAPAWTGGGAGILVSDGSPLIENNIIRNNTTEYFGGAIYYAPGSGTIPYAGVTITQNLIYGNQAGCGGGGALAITQSATYGRGLSLIVADNTIVNNGVKVGVTNCPVESSSQIVLLLDPVKFDTSYPGLAGPTAMIVDNIISGSEPAFSRGRAGVPPASEWNQPIFDHNILYNPAGALFCSDCIDVSSKYGNITADPQFVNAAANDYHLKASSPAIDSGNNSVFSILRDQYGISVTKDLDNTPRLQDSTGKGYPVVDIGAYEYRGLVEFQPTTIVLTCNCYMGSSSADGYGLTATLASPLGTPTGSVSFFLDGILLGSSYIDSTGVAKFATHVGEPGVHSLYATYLGQGSFTEATSVPIIFSLKGYVTTISNFSGSPNPSIVGQTVTFTVTSSSKDPAFAPLPITFIDGLTNTALGTATANSAKITTFSTNALIIGDHPMTATYPFNGKYIVPTTTTFQTVLPATHTDVVIVPSANPAAYNQSVTFTATVTNPFGTTGAPTGTVLFYIDGTPITTQSLRSATSTSATASFTTNTIPPGPHTIAGVYSSTNGLQPCTGDLDEVISGLVSTTILTATPNPQAAGQPVVLVASITIAGAFPAGTVTFYDGPTQLGTTPAIAGQATFTTSTLTLGDHSLTAIYTSTAISTSKSLPFVETITAPLAASQDFSITLASPTITIQSQHHLTTTLTLTSLSGFADSLALACANLPTYVTCRFTPIPTTLSANGTTTVSLSIDTDSVLGYARLQSSPSPHARPTSPINLALLLSPFGLFAAIAARRTGTSARRSQLRLLVLLLAAISLTTALSGCGSLIYSLGTPASATAGTYTIPIAASGATTGITHTTQLTLIVTP